METPIRSRRASRILLRDQLGRVLLFRGCDPANPARKYWFTVGGGIDEGEEPNQAAARELREETGIRVDVETLGEPVHHDFTEFAFDGYWVHQQQVFFALQVDATVIDTSGFAEIERRTMDQYRWWSGAELNATNEEVHPADLADLLARS